MLCADGFDALREIEFFSVFSALNEESGLDPGFHRLCKMFAK